MKKTLSKYLLLTMGGIKSEIQQLCQPFQSYDISGNLNREGDYTFAKRLLVNWVLAAN